VNVVLISLDTLRADHLSAYGYPRLTSPHLDRVAAGGSMFRTCIAPHIPTHPAHTTVFTGRDVFDHQIVSHGGPVELDHSLPTLAERLRAAGYFTAAADNLGRWFSRGFDLYQSYEWGTDAQGRWPKAEGVNRAVDTVFSAIAAQDKPFFCFLHYWDAHTPYLPPAPFWGMFHDGDPKDPANRSMEALWAFAPFRDYFSQWMPGITDIEFPKSQYDAEIAYMDTCLEHMWTMLTARGLDRDTLVVFFADHGEEMDEHQMWFDHHGLYETNIHVPLILWAPGKVPARTLDAPVSHYDIAPTVLEAAGIDPAALGLAGQSLWPLMRGETPPGTGTWEDGLYLSESSWMRKHGWRTREYKLIWALEPDFHQRPEVELYHLPSDPREQHNVAAERPEVVADLQQRLLAHLRRREETTGRPAPIRTQGITMRHIGDTKTAVPASKPEAPRGQ
jgi:arylsulfatase A-like enzyme